MASSSFRQFMGEIRAKVEKIYPNFAKVAAVALAVVASTVFITLNFKKRCGHFNTLYVPAGQRAQRLRMERWYG